MRRDGARRRAAIAACLTHLMLSGNATIGAAAALASSDMAACATLRVLFDGCGLATEDDAAALVDALEQVTACCSTGDHDPPGEAATTGHAAAATRPPGALDRAGVPREASAALAGAARRRRGSRLNRSQLKVATLAAEPTDGRAPRRDQGEARRGIRVGLHQTMRAPAAVGVDGGLNVWTGAHERNGYRAKPANRSYDATFALNQATARSWARASCSHLAQMGVSNFDHQKMIVRAVRDRARATTARAVPRMRTCSGKPC